MLWAELVLHGPIQCSVTSRFDCLVKFLITDRISAQIKIMVYLTNAVLIKSIGKISSKANFGQLP